MIVGTERMCICEVYMAQLKKKKRKKKEKTLFGDNHATFNRKRERLIGPWAVVTN